MKAHETKRQLANMLDELDQIRGAMDKLAEYRQALYAAIDQLDELGSRMQREEEG